jgi:hypothetical protein
VAKLTLADLSSLQNESSALSNINSNSALIETALENTLSRDGTSPNEMGANLDMNNNRILNLPAPVADQEPLRLVDGQALVDAAEDAQDGAEAALASFQDIWLGNQTGDPSTDLDASPLEGGELYYNTVTKRVRVYKLGTGWVDVAPFEDLVQIAAYVIAAAASAAAALTSENSAADSADAALADKIAAAASAVSAASSASAAEVARDIAIAKAAEAAASALEAAGHSDDAETAKTAAEAALDSFTDIYLGEKNGPPLLDNDGNALLVGALYYDTGDQQLKFYNGTVWMALTNAGLANVEDDISPSLGADLDLNGFDIIGTGNLDIDGDIEITGFIHAAGGVIDFDDNVNIDGTLNVEGATTVDDSLTVTDFLEVQQGAWITGGALPTQFSDPGVWIGTETNGNENFNIVSAGTYGYFDIGGINEDYKMRFLTHIATGNTVLGALGTIDINSGSTTSFNVAPLVPDDAYGSGWNGQLNVPTRNAIYDKIESILDGQTFTGAIIVPDEAYGSGWNGVLEVPTKNAVYDKIELVLGTTLPATYQPLDTDLTEIAGLSPANDDFLQQKGGVWVNRTIAEVITDLTTGLDALFLTPAEGNAAYQPLDSDLTTVAGLAPSNDDILQRKAGAWSNRTIAQLLTDLAAPGTTFQPLDADLTSIAALTTTAAGRSALVYADPNADKLIFWDDSASAFTSLDLPVGLVISNTTMSFADGPRGTVALVDGATPALDASLGNVFTLAAGGDRTIAVPSNPTNGQKIIIRHLASGGARTLGLNTGAGGFRFGSDIPSLTQTVSGDTDYIGCVYSSIDSFWDVVAYAKGF